MPGNSAALCLSCVDIGSPKTLSPLICCFLWALAPGEGHGGAEPPVPFFSLAFLLWSFLLVLQGSVYLLTSVLQPGAAASMLRASVPCTMLLWHAHADADGHPQFTHMRLLILPLLCAHMQMQGGLKRLSFINLALFLEEAHGPCAPRLTHPLCAHPVADKDGNSGASLWAPA